MDYRYKSIIYRTVFDMKRKILKYRQTDVVTQRSSLVGYGTGLDGANPGPPIKGLGVCVGC